MRRIFSLTVGVAALPFFASACVSSDTAPAQLPKPLDLPFQIQWKTQAIYLSSVTSVSPNLAWVVGFGGTIMGTVDGGKTWLRQASGTTVDLLGVSFADAKHGWVTGLRGTILATKNGGLTWDKQNSGTLTPLYGVHFINADRGWAVGPQGTVVTTGDGGKTWSRQPIGGKTEGLYGAQFIDAKHGWAVGDSGTVLATGDGGGTWASQPSGTTAQLHHVSFVDPQYGWAVGDMGTIVSTTDGGKTWTRQISNVFSQLTGVHFVDREHGWAVGVGGVILETSDGGTTWGNQVSGTISGIGGIHFADAQHGWAVGEDGLVMQTANAGKTWTTQASGHNVNAFIRVHFPDVKHGWAVGQAGTILATQDGGRTWAKQQSGSSATFFGVHFADALHGCAVGEGGTIVATEDGGKSWTSQTSETRTFLNRVDFADAHHGWAIGTDGSILGTTDGGKSWHRQARAMSQPLSGLSVVDAQHVWAVGTGGMIMATVDGGKSWNRQSSLRSPFVAAVDFSDRHHGWTVGSGGMVAATTDGGQSWIFQDSATQAGLSGVSFADNRHGWAVGQMGTIIATTDGGQTWALQKSETTESLFDVNFADAQHGWAVGMKGSILATADGGKSWVKQVVGFDKHGLSRVHFADLQHGWAVGLEGTIVATADGGENWMPQSSGTMASFMGTYFADAQHGWAVGTEGTIVATADGGNTWTPQSSGTLAPLNNIYFSDLQRGWAAGLAGTILATEDGGSTWKPQSSGTNAAFGSLVFTDALHGFAIGEAGTIIATVDGGKNWTAQVSNTSAGLLGVAFSDGQNGTAVGMEGTIVATADGGKTWTPQTSGTQATLVGVSFANVQHGWAVGEGGTIIATADGGKTWTVQQGGTASNLTSVYFADPHHGWAVGQNDTKLVATWARDAPCLMEFLSAEDGQEVKLSWKVRGQRPDAVTCVGVDFRQGSKAAWRSIDLAHVTSTGLTWAPEAPEYQVLPGTTLFYRVTLRDDAGLTYTHEVPRGYMYRPFWIRQPFWVKAGVYTSGALAAYLLACGSLLVIYPVGLVRLWSALSHALIESLDPSGSARSMVQRILALTGLPSLAELPRVRTDWVRLYRNGRSGLEDLAESIREEYLRQPEVLDVWVAQYRELACQVFENRFTVKSRLDNRLESKGWVPLPLWVLDRSENDPSPELLRQRLRPVFEKPIFRLLIHGEGGTGKTTLACLLATWVLEPPGTVGLSPHPMLPILIEHEFPASPNPVRDAIRSALFDLVGQNAPLSDFLLDQLLRHRRLLVIVDHLSEMSQETRAAILTNRHALPMNALVVTSRAGDELDVSVTDRIETLKIDGNHLTRFLDAYLTQRGKRELFTDTEYEESRRRLANMLGRTDRSIPVLFPKMYADRLTVDKNGPDGSEQPLSVPALMSYYVVDQNRNVAESDRISDDVVEQYVRTVAWECVRKDYRPRSAERSDVLAALRTRSLPEAALDYLIDRLRIVRREKTGGVRFGFDTLAEYLAAQDRVMTIGSDADRWRSFLDEADEAARRAPLGDSPSFLYAVWDCAASPSEQAAAGLDGNPLTVARVRPVPEEIIAEIGRRTGLDEASLRRIENLKFRNLIEQLTSKVVLLLGRFTPERKAVLDDLWHALRKLGYMPVVFDFDVPTRRDRLETATLLAYLSRFLVVDITAARSVPAELQSILPNLSAPVRPILDRRDPQGSFALFDDFAKFEWLLLPVFGYDNPTHLIASLQAEIVDPAEGWLRRWNPSARLGRNPTAAEPRRQVNEPPRVADVNTSVGPSSDRTIHVGQLARPGV
jgi:photosystem II stability/assembly factor-like uncharacterized protein